MTTLSHKNNASTLAERLSLISLAATLSVIMWHCQCQSSVERWILPSLCFWSVPWFFFLSGVLFVQSLLRRGAGDLLRAKFWSLLVPYVCWCIIGSIITGGSSYADICKVFALTKDAIHPSGNMALWYLRALIFFVLVSVSSFWMARRLRCSLICGLIFMGISYYCNEYVVMICTGSSPLYFAVGMFLSRFLFSDLVLSKRVKDLCMYSGLGAFVVFKGVYFSLGYDSINMGGNIWANLSYCGFMVFLWFLSEHLVGKLWCVKWLQHCCSLTAIVYFMHYPLVRRLIDWVLNEGIMSRNCTFVASWLISVWGCFWLAHMLRKGMPRVYSILSGGR